MSLHFDHAVIAVTDLGRAIQDYNDLGFTVVRGGVHSNRATENALIVFLDGTYLELLSKTEFDPLPNRLDFSPLLKDGEGLVGFALRSDDLDAEVVRLKDSGFSVGEVFQVERQMTDEKTIKGKLALLDNGFAPFLIQDITPREWRIPNDAVSTTHLNGAVGLNGVEIVVRSMEKSWAKYVRLFDYEPRLRASNYRTVECVNLYQAHASSAVRDPNVLPSYLTRFAGNVSQAEIDAADPDAEPRMFKRAKEYEAELLANHRRETIKENARNAAVDKQEEGLFAICLVREQWSDDLFTLERTHNVRFNHFLGTPPSRGEAILVGLDQVDWSKVHHAYGPATDVPKLLRDLASDDKAVRDHAYEYMNNGNIIHQGSIYEASIETIPFLMQLLNAPEVQDKPHILDLLEGVTFGGMGEEELQERTQILLKDALPIYLAQFDNSDPHVRSLIAEQLSLFEAEILLLEPILKEKIVSDNSPHVRSTCVSSLAGLWMTKRQAEMRPWLNDEHTVYIADLMRDVSQMLAVQFTAAKILVRDDPSRWVYEGMTLFYRIMRNDIETLKTLNGVWLGGIFYEIKELLKAYPNQLFEWMRVQAQHPDAEIRECIPNAFSGITNPQPPSELATSLVASLLNDTSPDVRLNAVNFFYHAPYIPTVIGKLKDIAEHDPSLNIRVAARNTLKRQKPASN